jgi:hypothetical protein
MSDETGLPHARDAHSVPGDVVVYASKPRVLLLTLFSFMVLVVAALFTFGPLRGGAVSVTDLIVFMLALLAFGGGTVRGIRILISSRPRLVVSHDGIAVAPTSVRSGLIPWAGIKELRTMRSGFQGLLEIAVNDEATVLGLHSQLGRLARLGFTLVGVVTIGDAQLAVSVTDIVAELRTHFSAELAHHGIAVIARRRA